MPGAVRVKEPPFEKRLLGERIRRRAYELYVVRGHQPGSELEDWLQAEQEIRAREQSIDEASQESFPASDPPAY